MDFYHYQKQPLILNEHNMDTLNYLLNQFIDQVKGDTEAWSQKGSGWVIDDILEAYINVAQYRPLRGGSYMELAKKLKNKKAILNIQNRDNQCLRWAIRQPRSQGHFPGLRAGREKTLASAGHVSTLHPENLGVIN